MPSAFNSRAATRSAFRSETAGFAAALREGAGQLQRSQKAARNQSSAEGRRQRSREASARANGVSEGWSERKEGVLGLKSSAQIAKGEQFQPGSGTAVTPSFPSSQTKNLTRVFRGPKLASIRFLSSLGQERRFCFCKADREKFGEVRQRLC